MSVTFSTTNKYIKQSSNNMLTNLVAYWKLDETSGTIVDSHGNNDVVSNHSVTYGSGSNGILGNAMIFDYASTSYLELADASDLQMYNSNFTFSAWIYITTYPGGGAYRGIIGGEASSAHFMIRGIDATSAYLYLSGDALGGEGPSISGANAWIHVAVTYNDASATNNIVYYINGTPTTASGDIDVLSGCGSIWLGARNDGYDTVFPMTGRLDEVGFWKGRILSGDDITWLYNTGSARDYSEFS